MPTLTVDGRDVQVDEAFLKLSPEQQNATVDEIARSMGSAQQPGTALEKPGGVVANLGAGGNKMIADAVGAPVDAMSWFLNKAAEHFGRKEPLITAPVGGSESIKSAFGLVGADPRNVGENTTADRVARRVGGDAMAMLGPYMGARALIARGVGAATPAAADAVSVAPGSLSGSAVRMLGAPGGAADAGELQTGLGALGNAAIGAGASLGGQGAETLLPEGSPWAPTANFAGQMLGGGLMAGGMGVAQAGAGRGAALAQDLFGSAERAAGNRLRGAASDPATLAARIEQGAGELVPGSRPTTFQATGDLGVGRLESDLRLRNPAPFVGRAAEQGEARGAALQGLAPEANPGAVRDVLQQRLARLDQEGEALVGAARQNAQQMLEMAGGRLSPEEYGAAMRGELEAAKSAAKRQESALWRAIDPDGKLTINGQAVREAANRIAGEIPKTARGPEGEELAVLGHARLLGTAAPFSDFAALRGRLLQAIREEGFQGQTPALRRMQMLRSAMDGAISETANKAARDDPTLLGRLSQRGGDVYGGPESTAAAANPGLYGGAVSPDNTGLGSQLDAGVPGAAGNPGGGPGRAAGYPSVPEPHRPQDLIQFLASRGGVADEGGDLRALDLHKINPGVFGRVSRSNGMPLDDARELAVEAGYLHPDSDINDLLAALRRNAQGQPVFNEGEAGAVEWRAFDRARQRGEYEGVPPLPGEPANFDAAAAARYRAAADATRSRAGTFNNPQIGPVLRERGGAYQMAESRVPERFLSSPEGSGPS
jgi:hypothetical protein